MAKAKNGDRNESMVKRVGEADFLAPFVQEDDSLAGMEQHVIIPRLKIIQSMTDPELKKKAPEGSVILRPSDMIVAEPEQPFLFVPQFFFVEFTKMSDRRDKTGPMILGRSFDPTSEIAKRSENAETRFEVYEGHEKKPDKDQWKYRYVKHFRFPGVLYEAESDFFMTPTVISFERGEHFQGRNFVSAIKMRKVRVGSGEETRLVPQPLWSQVWQLHTAIRPGNEGSWYGFDFEVAHPSSIIAEEHVAEFREAHNALKEAHLQNRLMVDGDDSDEAAPPEDAEDM